MRTDPITLLLDVPPGWTGRWAEALRALLPDATVLVNGVDDYAPARIDYAATFRPKPGFLKTLANVKVVFSLGAGVDGIVCDPDYPRQIPLVRFVDHTLARDLAQYVVMHVLIHHRAQRAFDAAQSRREWRQHPQFVPAEDRRVGILGLGEIGALTAARLRDLDFPVTGWSRTRKAVAGVASFAGLSELPKFLAGADILVCLLPLTAETRGILNAKTFAQLPKGAFVINAARGGHLIEPDLIAAIDSGHLCGAALDVFQTEPLPETSPLWAHPKITVTPHVAAITDPVAAASSIAAGIAAHQRGDVLENVVDLARGY
ncbi:MAG: glyoxylate/hydroxypyruvate reductase A [Pseudomonadota bacterium]|nr:glyoxylate/hydroxypyruvate reductase A [Pseudomonadota bacterium]